MSKIAKSLALVVFMGAIVVGGTGAFFSDEETSTGNIFTAGAIDLLIDSEAHYNGMVCQLTDQGYIWVFPGGQDANQFEEGEAPYLWGEPCGGSWELTDLEDGVHRFFSFDDVKPGDEGENTISIHIDNNPAWMCMDIETTSNDDVDCTEPELADDPTCEVNDDEFDGELAQNLNFFAWLDDGAIDGFQGEDEDPTEGDNIWQDGENPLFSNFAGPMSDTIGGVTYALADSNTPFGPISPAETQYIGLYWCAGEITSAGPGQLECDGSVMDNAAQTDEAIADITFRIEQSRNNDDFVCSPDDGGGLACNEANDVMFVLDSSGSIDDTELADLETAAKAFATALNPQADGNHIGVVDFDDDATLTQELTDVIGSIETAIDNLISGGTTDLAGGISVAQTELASVRDRNDLTEAPDFMVIMTDGDPTDAVAASAAAEAAKAAGITLLVIGIGDGVNDAYLETIASGSGNYFTSAEFSDLEDVLEGLADCPIGDLVQS